MADRSSQSIVIDAPAAQIMLVIADFESYPDWVGAVRACEVLEIGADGAAKRVHFVLDAGVVKDDYVLSYDWAADGRSVTWDLEQGQMQKSQYGSYVLQEQGASTLVTYTLTVELSIPMLGVLKRKAEKVIMDTALKELKKRVENDPLT